MANKRTPRQAKPTKQTKPSKQPGQAKAKPKPAAATKGKAAKETGRPAATPASRRRSAEPRAVGPNVTLDSDGGVTVRIEVTASDVAFLAGNAALEAGDVDGALRSYREALAGAPEDAAIHHNLSHALAQAGQLAEAVAACSQAIDLEPAPAYLAQRAALYRELGELGPALGDIDAALDSDGGDTARNHMLRGLICYDGEAFEDAVTELEAARDRDDSLPDLYFHLGKALLRMDLLEEAERAFSTDIRRDQAPMSYYNRHVVRLRLGKRAAAGKDLDEAIGRDPDNPYFFQARARLRSDEDDVAGAEADFAETVRLSDEAGEFIEERGRFYFAHDRLEEAAADFAAALLAGGDAAACHEGRAAALCRLGRVAEALADFDALVGMDPDSPSLLSNRGFALQSLGRVAEALADYDASARLDPDYAQVRYNRAALREQEGDLRGAREDYEQLARLGYDVAAQLARLGSAPKGPGASRGRRR